MRYCIFTAAAFLVIVLSWKVSPHHTKLDNFPDVVFWAWARPEDLRGLNPSRYGIAYLDQTITVTDQLSSLPRVQRLLVSPRTKLMAVIRIEAPMQKANLSDPKLPGQITDLVLRSASEPGVSAIQIDFDAVASQRGFYAALLHEIRKRLPNDMPLSMTALVSWCGADDWLAALPVDEAVPMFFRMGRDYVPRGRPGWTYPIREPLCSHAAGVSTDEPWPKTQTDQRLYIFHPTSWNEIALRNAQRMVDHETLQ